MHSALEKLGLYDFFGVFLTGILAVAIGLFLNLPLTCLLVNTENNIIDLILFFLECYFIGIILQEISSFLDSHFFKLQKTARCSFLNNTIKIIDNELELHSCRQFANQILGINEIVHTYNTTETEYVFFYMKSFLEIKGKNDMVERLSSLYGMSRSLAVAFTLCLIAYFLYNIKTLTFAKFLVILVLLALIYLFYNRAKRFCEYRVRKILRLYANAKQSLP